MFRIDRLRALAAVATHGSIARAAETLHLTASGVSQQLAKLDRETGHRLLEPDGRGVRLTHAGRVLANHAHRILADLAEAEADLAGIDQEVLGPLRIGGVGSAVRALVPEVLATLLAEHPRLEPAVADGEAVDLLPRLLDGHFDLLLIESWDNLPTPLPEGLRLRTVVTEDVLVAVPAGHPSAGAAAIALADLAGTPWASCPPGTAPYNALVQAARAAGTEPKVRYPLAEHYTQLAMVQKGLAVALLPAMSCDRGTPGVRFLPSRPALKREIKAAWLVGTPAVRACVTEIEALARAR